MHWHFIDVFLSLQPQFVAIFDYNKADDDEITILEGDGLVETLAIDEGWMEGKNLRTGLYGMFPSNYVQAV